MSRERRPRVSGSAGLVSAMVVLAATNAAGHHGVAPHYDTSQSVRIEGEVTRFDFVNPHAFVYIDVMTPEGERQNWQCELASRTVLTRNGLTAQTFSPGDRVTIEGVPARHNPTGCAFRLAWLPDGTVLRSTEYFSPVSELAAPAAANPLAIDGIWTMKQFNVLTYAGAMTPAGEAARAAFDPILDDPAIYCDPASPIRFWVNVNEPFEIRREPGRIVIDHSFLDYQRVVYLDQPEPPPGFERNSMGYSTGYLEGRVLVIETGYFTRASLEPRYGVMHSENLRLTERLEVNPETGELEMTWIIDDPEFFIEPFTQREFFVRTAESLQPYECEPGYRN